jgi:hypothetical protein
MPGLRREFQKNNRLATHTALGELFIPDEFKKCKREFCEVVVEGRTYIIVLIGGRRRRLNDKVASQDSMQPPSASQSASARKLEYQTAAVAAAGGVPAI